MKIFFDNLIAWGNYFTQWVLYVASCFKTVLDSMAHLRDHWPDRPVIPKPTKSTVSNSEDTNPVRVQPENDQVLDGGQRV